MTRTEDAGILAARRPAWVLPGLAVGMGAAALTVGGLSALHPRACVLLILVSGIAFAVWRQPVLAAVLVAVVTPLVAGIDRGRIVPILRPNEALVAFLAGVMVVRALVTLPTGHRWTLRITRIDVVLLAMAVANSVVPLAVMVLRGQPIEADDVTYALVLWKYLALYALVRTAVTSDRHIQLCLWASLASATVVALIGALQALDLVGMRQMLADYYAPYGYTGALAAPRGGSTVGLPAAAADLLVLNIVAATGLWWKDRRHGPLLLGVIAACTAGTFGAAEFSSALGLAIAVVSMALVARRPRTLRWIPLGVGGAVVLMWPVIEHRLEGFQSPSGWPVSWTTRLYNLKTYFLPDLFSGTNPLLGVRPAARVVADHHGVGFVWIESGYLWLLWGGGLPLLGAYVAFVWVTLRTLRPMIAPLDSYASVAALAAFSGIVSLVALMAFDPHLTYRGSADWLFSLLAITVGALLRRETESPRPTNGRSMPRNAPPLVKTGG